LSRMSHAFRPGASMTGCPARFGRSSRRSPRNSSKKDNSLFEFVLLIAKDDSRKKPPVVAGGFFANKLRLCLLLPDVTCNAFILPALALELRLLAAGGRVQ